MGQSPAGVQIVDAVPADQSGEHFVRQRARMGFMVSVPCAKQNGTLKMANSPSLDLVHVSVRRHSVLYPRLMSPPVDSTRPGSSVR
jgi:hypothetical protein